MKEIQLQLMLPEVNQILEALGEMPYQKVYQLIAKVQQQAEGQLKEAESQEVTPANNQ